MAQDILRFHCVYWPAMLLVGRVRRRRSRSSSTATCCSTTSRSRSRSATPSTRSTLIDVYGADPLRFWCARAVPFGQDGNASLAGIAERYERELGNDLGNLLSRTTAMVASTATGRLPGAPDDSSEIAAAIAAVQQASDDIDRFDITGALERIWALVRALNRHVTETKPWELAKDEANAEQLDQVLYDLSDGLRAAAVALFRVSARDRAEDPRRARPAAGARLGAGRLREARRRRRDRGGAAALPAHRAAGRRRGVTAARDRHPRASRRRRGRGARARARDAGVTA